MRALSAAGKWKAGVATLEPIVAEAQKLSYRPFEAEALFELGYLQSRHYDDRTAEATMRRAVVAATEGRHDFVAARASVELTQIVGTGEGRFDDALEWSKFAFAWLARIGGDEGEQAKLHAILGSTYEGLSQFDAARQHHELALALRRKRFGPENREVARSLRGLGDIAQDQAKLEEAKDFYERTLAMQEKVDSAHPDLGLTLLDLGDVLFALGRTDDALRDYQRAESIARTTLGPDHFYTASAMVGVANVDARRGAYDEALARYQQSLAIEEKAFGPVHREVARILALIGNVQVGRGEWAGGIESCTRALAIWDKTLGKDHPDRAIGLVAIGHAELALRRPASAIAPLEQALRLNIADRYRRAQARFDLARALRASGPDRARARELAAQARTDYLASSAPARISEVDAFLASSGGSGPP